MKILNLIYLDPSKRWAVVVVLVYLVVSVFAFDSNNVSSTPAEVYNSYFEENKDK